MAKWQSKSILLTARYIFIELQNRMSQQELADLVGVSRQTIIQLERNRYNPSMLLAYSIAKVFDVAIEDLFDFEEAEK